MTVKIPVRVVPGAVAPAGATVYDLSAATRVTPIGGRPKTLVNRMTATLTAVQQDVIGAGLLTLIDAGVMAKLDRLCIVGRNEADTLLDWCGGAATVNTSTSGSGLPVLNYVPGVGMKPPVLGGYLTQPVLFGKFQLGNACAFGYVSETTGGSLTPLLGVAATPSDGPDTLRIYPRQSSGTLSQCRLNSTTTVAGAYPGTSLGLWCVTEVSGSVGLYRSGNVVAAPQAVTVSAKANTMRVDGQASDRGLWGVAAWGYGAALSTTEQSVLTGVIESLLAMSA